MAADIHFPIESRIRVCNGRPTLLAVDLAALYGVPIQTLLEYARKSGPVPGELAFVAELDPSDVYRGYRAGAGYVFTAYGAVAVAHSLGTAAAIEKSTQVIRALLRFQAEMSRGEQPRAPAPH